MKRDKDRKENAQQFKKFRDKTVFKTNKKDSRDEGRDENIYPVNT